MSTSAALAAVNIASGLASVAGGLMGRDSDKDAIAEQQRIQRENAIKIRDLEYYKSRTYDDNAQKAFEEGLLNQKALTRQKQMELDKVSVNIAGRGIELSGSAKREVEFLDEEFSKSVANAMQTKITEKFNNVVQAEEIRKAADTNFEIELANIALGASNAHAQSRANRDSAVIGGFTSILEGGAGLFGEK